jgi:hypothetical protein
MKCAVLCNGDSRSVFTSTDKYNYLIGCNIPWRQVDATVILDVNVLDKWNEPCPFYSSVSAWRELHKRERFEQHFLGFVDTFAEYDSSGHAATRKVIELGYKEIDIYGCDSWFTNDTESYTHQWVDGRAIDMNKQISVWRARWYELMAKHPDVKINFIGNPK